MGKSTFFTGQPVFNQLLSLIPDFVVRNSARKYKTDRYYKYFHSYDHLVTLLYSVFHQCQSLREVCTGLLACSERLSHVGMSRPPARSTLAEANQKRSSQFFSEVYHLLYQHYYRHSPDSRRRKGIEQRLYITDSTTIKLFSDVMQGLGTKPLNGKSKGGAKAHILMKAEEDVPRFICLSEAKINDKIILSHIDVPKGSIMVFDKGYNSYKQFKQWTKDEIWFVTRIVENAWQELVQNNPVSEKENNAGVLSDEWVLLGRPSNKTTSKIKVRKIHFRDPATQKELIFITNHSKLKATTIADIYKRRWQIELFFKRIKQNYPLRYFLGDSENAIKIQIWCSFIADLLVKVLKEKTKRKWSYANLSAMLKHHLMTYIDLISFLNNPEKALKSKVQSTIKVWTLFSPAGP